LSDFWTYCHSVVFKVQYYINYFVYLPEKSHVQNVYVFTFSLHEKYVMLLLL